MTPRTAPAGPARQRNALAPGILAALILFTAPALISGPWFILVQYAVTILALIVGWFGVQARQWWWAPVFLLIAVLWNPVLPFAFAGVAWTLAQLAAATVFLVAGSAIRVDRAPDRTAR